VEDGHSSRAFARTADRHVHRRKGPGRRPRRRLDSARVSLAAHSSRCGTSAGTHVLCRPGGVYTPGRGGRSRLDRAARRCGRGAGRIGLQTRGVTLDDALAGLASMDAGGPGSYGCEATERGGVETREGRARTAPPHELAREGGPQANVPAKEKAGVLRCSFLRPRVCRNSGVWRSPFLARYPGPHTSPAAAGASRQAASCTMGAGRCSDSLAAPSPVVGPA